MKSVIVKLDPTGAYQGVAQENIIRALGILPQWAAEAMQEGAEGGFKDALINNYPFYMGDMTGGTMTEEGIYSYPNDPDLAPLASMAGDGETCFFYEHAIVAVRTDKGNVWMSRFD